MMNSLTSLARRSLWRLIAQTAIFGLVAWYAVATLRVGLLSAYSLDELQYSHGAWAMARGAALYRDVFEHHFPFLQQLLAMVWSFLDDDPENLQVLRIWMLPVPALLAVGGWWLNRAWCGRWSVLTAAVLLMLPTLTSMAVQVRPDPLAAALFLGALGAATAPRLSPRWRGWLAGALFVAAAWTTLKVVYYGLVIIAAWIADVVAGRKGRRRDGAFLGDPWAFAFGAITMALPIAGWLTSEGLWGDWYHWCIAFSFEHQWHYPGFSWQRNLDQVVQHAGWLLPFAAVGVVATVRRGPGPTRRADLLLLGALVTTFASFVWQSAPYLYSLVPFTVVAGIFAARGMVETGRWIVRTPRLAGGARVFVLALLALLALGQVRRTDFAFAKIAADDNGVYRQRLARLGEMTKADQAVFHVWGGQVSRPSVHYFFFLEAVTMKLQEARLRAELVPAMIEKGVTVYLHHDLFPRLVPELRRYLLDNFLPYDEGLWVWGRRFGERPDRPGADDTPGDFGGPFVAVRDGRYFLWPLEALESGGELLIDGRPATSPIVTLQTGPYEIAYRGRAREIFLMWLPEDGRPFEPKPALLPGGRLSEARPRPAER